MKILHIIDTLRMGGAENVLASLAVGQHKLGHEVVVMPLVCPKYTPVREMIENQGIKVAPLKENGSFFDPLLILKIRRNIKHYDIVHVHLFPALYWVACAKSLSFSKVPIVYTEHSTNNKRRGNPFFHMIDRYVYQNGYKMVIACAEKVMETYKSAFPSINHVCFINNGVDTLKFRDATPYTKEELLGVSKNTFVVTMVARFMSMKRQDTIVEAISKLPDYIHAVFVGGNETDEGLLRVKSLSEEKGVSERVHFLYIRKDVPRILKTSDVVIMASDYEGLSLSSIEGMAAGKPFIATDVNGLREVVGGAGVLFENKDSDALASIINKLATDSAFYDKIVEDCSQRANEYDIKRMIESYMNIYNKVI